MDQEVKTYDFANIERVPKEAIRTISILNENLSKIIEQNLSNYLRIVVEVNLEKIEQISFGRFIEELPVPTSLAIFSVKPLVGNALMELSLNLSLSLIDRLMGGSGSKTSMKDREPTEIEQAILERINYRILDSLTESWSHIVEMKPFIEANETNPQFAQIVPLNETVVTSRFQVKIGEHVGSLKFCVPFLTLENIIGKLSSLQWMSEKSSEDVFDDSNSIVKLLSNVKIPIKANLAKANIRLSKVYSLKKGDFINLPYSRRVNVEVLIKDKIKFLGKAGLFKNKKAVKITKSIKKKK